MKNHIWKLFLSIGLVGCEKIVDLDYKRNESTVTIEGNITMGTGPHRVKITKSVALAETGMYPAIDNAVVVISDDVGNNEVLIPQGEGLYITESTEGTPGRTYTLTVTVDSQTYTAQSTMPEVVPFEFIKISEVPIGNDIERNIIPVYLDPASKGNHYRFVMWLNGKLVNQHLVQNDEVKNGLQNTIKLEINDDDLDITPGDVIELEMQCIDKQIAAFYTTLALMGDSGPGGGTTPTNPPSNLSGGALGAFSAHTTERRSVTIP
jgi:Domain of unknown function (DUF4249)